MSSADRGAAAQQFEQLVDGFTGPRDREQGQTEGTPTALLSDALPGRGVAAT